MKKRILAILLWLGGSAAFAQSINNQSPSTLSVDGSNTTGAKVLTLPQVQPTQQYNASPTPTAIAVQQASNWFQLNGNGAALVEFASNTFTGTYAVQVSDNPTPVSTPGTNIYTAVRDTATYATGGQGAQTANWSYMIREGWRWMRLLCTPDINNAPAGGTLNFQVRLFGNPVQGDAIRSYYSGVPWKQSEKLVDVSAQTAVTNYYDYKLPNGSKGFYLYTNTSAVSGASTITCTPYVKDPVSGQLQALGTGVATHAAGLSTFVVGGGIAGSAPSGASYFTLPCGEDIVIGDALTGTGNSTFTQTAVPIQ